jgi:hypothetical protein
MNMRFFFTASILFAIIFAVSAMPALFYSPCVTQCQKTDSFCLAVAGTGVRGCCQAKCDGDDALEDYKKRYLVTSTSLTKPKKTFKDNNYNSCVQSCRKNDQSSAAWGNQGLHGYCEHKCKSPDHLHKFHTSLLKE